MMLMTTGPLLVISHTFVEYSFGRSYMHPLSIYLRTIFNVLIPLPPIKNNLSKIRANNNIDGDLIKWMVASGFCKGKVGGRGGMGGMSTVRSC